MKTIKHIFTLTMSVAYSFGVFATDYYVRTNGNDNNNGRSNTANGAWKSIANKVGSLNPGDVLWIADGTYFENEIKITNKTGSDANRVVIRAINSKLAKISSTSAWSAININNCTGVTIQDIEVSFPAGSTSKQYCILADESNFISVKNTSCYNAGCSGIQLNTSDNLLIEGNYVYGCATRSEYNGSGISVGFLKEKSNSGAPFAVIIRNNISQGNSCDLPFTPGGYNTPTDGNGIICDFWQENGYTKAGLIENNLCYNNGGKGVHVFGSNNVTVRNNTAWHNGRILKKYGGNHAELSAMDANNCTFANNIGVELGDANTLAGFNNGSNNVFNHNMFIGDITKCNGIGNINKTTDTYPKFVSPNTNGELADFHLQSTSPAINAGVNNNTSATDLDWISRPQGGIVDMGCYEYEGTITSVNIESEVENLEISVFPNPFTSSIHISQYQSWILYNAIGERLENGNSDLIDGSNLMSGMYLLKLSDGSVHELLK